ncbi:hypothetical protein [Kribbella sp. NPDC051770]
MSEPDYTRLPDPIRIEDTVSTHPGTPVLEPEGGRNVEQDIATGVVGG